MEDEVYEKYNKNDYNQKPLQEKYDLLGIPFEKILEKTRLANDDDLSKGILYGQLVGFKPVGTDCEEYSKTLKYLVNMDQGDESSLAIIYGVAVEEQKNNIQKIKNDSSKKDPLAYIVREWVAGHGFTNGEDLFEKDLHDRLVILYRLIKQIQYIHNNEIPYIFLKPNKIIVTIDMDIKLMDFVKVDEFVLEKIKKDIERKNGKVNNQHRFLYPGIFKEDFKLKRDNNRNLIGDRKEEDEGKDPYYLNLDKNIKELKTKLLNITSESKQSDHVLKQDLEEQLEQYEIDFKWKTDVEEIKKNNKNSDHEQKIKQNNKEIYEKEYSGSEKREFKIFHREFVKYRKFDIWSLGCLIYYSLKEEYPWVDFRKNGEDGQKENESSTLKTAKEIYNEFEKEMKKDPKDRYFFISEEDVKNSQNDERGKMYQIARMCLSGEFKNVDDILGRLDNKNDSKLDDTRESNSDNNDKVCFHNLKILKDFFEKGEVHYDFNTACAKMVYNIQELVKAYHRLQERKIYEPNLMKDIMREI